MFTSYDKAIVAVIMGVCSLLTLWFHVTIPGWVDSDHILQAIAIVTPLLVWFTKNKVTTQQKTEVLVNAGVQAPKL